MKMTEVRRKVYTYRHTLMVAERMAAQAKEDKERDNSIVAIVFCAFTIEGYLNHAGEELIPKWNELFEILRPKAKLIFLSERYGIDIEFGLPPFQSFGTIFEIRNQLAHPKIKNHDYKDKKGKVWLKIGVTEWPAEKWESLCEARYAKSFVESTKEMIKLLDNALPTEKVPDFLLSENV